MNKLIASVGAIALGTSVIQAVETGALNAQQTKKAWSVSASLRGFYDDNFNSQPSATKESSTGAEIGAGVDYGVAGDMTSVNFGYDFNARYYEKALNAANDRSDFTHNLNATLTHAASERLRFTANEQFVVGQEPEFLAQGSTISNPQRVSGDNYRNSASVGANFQATSRLGLGVNYNNSITDYEDEGDDSSSSRLDRMEHTVAFQPSWVLTQQTVAIGRIQYSRSDFAREDELLQTGFTSTGKSRDSRSLVISGGLQHEFNNNLSGSFEIGGQRVEFPNNPATKETWTPWAEASVDYQLQSQTSIRAGVSYRRSPSDLVASVSNSDFVTDAKAASIYAELSHQLSQRFEIGASARYQSLEFNGGIFDGRKDNFLLLGLNAAYQINPNLEANAGYNFDDLSSDAPGRTYERNKVYLGLTARY